MEPDRHLLLSLIAVRMNGEKPSPKLDVFKKLKTYIENAKKQELLKEESIEVNTLVKGKAKTKRELVLALTELGKQYLETHGGDAARAAAVVAQSAAAATQASDLQQQLQADRASLRTEVLASLNSKPKGPDPSKELKALAKKLDELAKAVETLETKLKPTDEDGILAQIDSSFDKLEKKLHASIGASSKLQPIQSAPEADTKKTLQTILRDAYENLCLYIEFDSGVVELPRLYHEARKAKPDLTVHAFHQELESLWAQRVLELKVLNEVRSAKEQDKAIRRGDNLYYFIFWPQK